MNETCKFCKHSIFDNQWGEYKCRIKMTRVDADGTCDYYDNRKVFENDKT